MTTTTAHKRLDEIETQLTPKEWAIKMADELRAYPDSVAYIKAQHKLPFDQLTVCRAFTALQAQAGERHPGHKPEDIRARNGLTNALWKQFHTLKLLIRRVDQAMQGKVGSIGLQAALRLSALHALMLQDAFARTATRAAALIATQKRREMKRERQAALKELAAFMVADLGETPPDGVPPQDALSRYPTPLAEWNHELTALLEDFVAHRAAVELVQGQHFDGHPILSPDLEAELTEAARMIESAVATANEYLKRRAELPNAESSAGACESDPAIALESIKARANGQRAAAIAEQWLGDARHEATESDAERWERCREEFEAKE